MSALAEMERELIVERTRAGLAAAREQVADVIGAGVKTVYKYFPAFKLP